MAVVGVTVQRVAISLSLSRSLSLSLSLALSLSIFDLIEAIIRHSPEATETFSVVGGRPGF